METTQQTTRDREAAATAVKPQAQAQAHAPARAQARAPAITPPVDVFEDESGITLKADLPGVSRENLSVYVDGDQLTIEGHMSLGENARLEPAYAEIRVAHYSRTFALSRELDMAKIDAKMHELTHVLANREAAAHRCQRRLTGDRCMYRGARIAGPRARRVIAIRVFAYARAIASAGFLSAAFRERTPRQ